MSPNDLATKADLQALTHHLEGLLRQLAPAPAADFLTLQQAAEATHTSIKTVRKWIKTGKRDAKGQLIKLATLEFSPGFVRIPRAALLAYGRSLGFDERQLLSASVPGLRVAS